MVPHDAKRRQSLGNLHVCPVLLFRPRKTVSVEEGRSGHKSWTLVRGSCTGRNIPIRLIAVVFWHHGAELRPPSTSQHYSIGRFKGKGRNSAPIMPRDASLSDSLCKFFESGYGRGWCARLGVNTFRKRKHLCRKKPPWPVCYGTLHVCLFMSLGAS